MAYPDAWRYREASKNRQVGGEVRERSANGNHGAPERQLCIRYPDVGLTSTGWMLSLKRDCSSPCRYKEGAVAVLWSGRVIEKLLLTRTQSAGKFRNSDEHWVGNVCWNREAADSIKQGGAAFHHWSAQGARMQTALLSVKYKMYWECISTFVGWHRVAIHVVIGVPYCLLSGTSEQNRGAQVMSNRRSGRIIIRVCGLTAYSYSFITFCNPCHVRS
jgi:hypothetical protein